MILSHESIEQLLNSLSVKGKSSNTVRAYRADLMGLLRSLPAEQDYPDLETLTAGYLTRNKPTWAVATMARKLAAFRAYGAYMGDPTFLADYKAPSVPGGIAHPIAGGVPAVREMISEARKPHHKHLLVLCGLMGLRVTEARSVRPKDFEFKADGIYLRVRGKGEKTRVLPVPDEVAAYLAQAILLTESDRPLVPIGDRAARSAVSRLGKRADLGKVASHDLRMTVGTAAYEATGDLRATQELLGHASSQTTEGYTGVKMDTLRKALGSL